MIIKLKSNSSRLTEVLNRSNFNVEYGYSISTTQEVDGQKMHVTEFLGEEDSWWIKLSKKLDKILNRENYTDFKKSMFLVEGLSFLEASIDQKDWLEGMSVQINSGNIIHKSVFNIYDSLVYSNPELSEKVSGAVNDKAAFMSPDRKQMVLGLNFFSDKSDISFSSSIMNSLGTKRALQFIVFHEMGHALDVKNEYAYSSEMSNKTRDLISNMDSILNNNVKVMEVAKDIPVGFKGFDIPYFNNIHRLKSEIYADSFAFLMSRNKDIVDKKYNQEDSHYILDSVLDARRKEQLDCASSPANQFGHFTAPGLEYIKENYDKLPNRVMSQKEIHETVIKCVEQGLARVLITSVSAKNENVSKLETIFNMEVNDNTARFNPSKTNYKEIMDSLKELAGDKWVKDFNEKIKDIDSKNYSDTDTVVWLAGLHPKKLDSLLWDQEKKKQEQLESLASSESARTNALALEKSNDNSFDDMGWDLQEKITKSSVLKNMDKMRQQSSPQSKSSFKNTP